jgi:thiamine-phosphate pyrophosphorylase
VTNDNTAGCQLYVIVSPGVGAREALTAALKGAPVASVLVRPAEGQALGAGEVKPLVELAQKQNVAVVLQDDAQLARTVRADGVHLTSGKDIAARYQAAREILGRGAIVGIDPGISRHDAMELAEAGADYVAFGAPAVLKDRARGLEKRDELIGWWAEIFQIPCVALDVETADDAAALALAGADFIGVTLPAADAETFVRGMARALREGADA